MMSNSNYYRPFEKPLQHLGIDDWRSRTNQLCNLASAHRTNAFDLIQASRSVRNENRVQSHFNTAKNTIRLANRLSYLLLYSISHSHSHFAQIHRHANFSSTHFHRIPIPIPFAIRAHSQH